MEIINLLSAPYPQKRKTSSKSKENVMMDEAMSILQSKNNKVHNLDEAFGMTIGASLRSISNIRNKEFLNIKIQEIIFQPQFINPMVLFVPIYMMQTLPIPYPPVRRIT